MAEYRLAPAVVLRSAGAAFVLLAVAVLALSVVTALAGWSFLVVGVVAGLGLLGVVGRRAGGRPTGRTSSGWTPWGTRCGWCGAPA